MNYGYNEILEALVKEYEKLSDEALWSESEMYKRFEAIASELYALSCFANKNMKQAFAQTATGSYLDIHARLKDIERKPASFAKGKLLFSINEALDEDITIPKGTVCSVKDNPYLQFSTSQEAVIPSGELSVMCDASAIESGRAHNVKSGMITVMVNAPVGVGSVTNPQAFSGGKDEESDTHLRNRIMSHYSTAQNGVNASSIENLILGLDYIRDCHIPNAFLSGVMSVFVCTTDDFLDDGQIEEICSLIKIDKLFGAEVTVDLAFPASFSVSVEVHIKSGYEKDNIEQEVYDTVRDICLASRIGRPLEFNTISNALSKFDGIEKFRVTSPQALGDAVYCDYDEYLLLDSLAVEVIE